VNHIVMLGAYEVDGAGLGSSLMSLSFVVVFHFLTMLSTQYSVIKYCNQNRSMCELREM